jgi:hypothetical protein
LASPVTTLAFGFLDWHQLDLHMKELSDIKVCDSLKVRKAERLSRADLQQKWSDRLAPLIMKNHDRANQTRCFCTQASAHENAQLAEPHRAQQPPDLAVVRAQEFRMLLPRRRQWPVEAPPALEAE